MEGLSGFEPSGLEFVAPDHQVHILWLKVKDALALLWVDNPKAHDLGALAASIERYGFVEPSVWDATLHAVKSGNGRIEALAWMERQGRALPKGGGRLPESGEWVMPVLTGVDAASYQDALAYAIDANNLTMTGGDYSPYEMAKMWDRAAYTKVLGQLLQSGSSSMPVSLGAEDYQTMLKIFQMEAGHWDQDAAIDPDQIERRGQHAFRVIVEDMEEIEAITRGIRALIEQEGWNAHLAL